MLFLLSLLYTLLAFLPALLSIAFLTLLERKLMALVQLRHGPDVLALAGLLQPIADGLKLLTTAQLAPLAAYPLLFFLSPSLMLMLSLLL